MKKRGLFIVLIIISFVSIKITAQIAGSNDVTFNTIDSGNGIGDAANNEVNVNKIACNVESWNRSKRDVERSVEDLRE